MMSEDIPDMSVGDVVWYVPRGFALAVQCKITEIDDWARRQHPSGYIFYWIDEPVGHSLCSDELFLTREDAMEFLKKECSDRPLTTLEGFRKRVVKFIVSTHDLSEDESVETEERVLQSYPPKTPEEWFVLIHDA